MQRIKAEGDYAAAKKLFETYGVHFDAKLRDEVVARVEQLNMPSYTGFVQPRLEAVKGAGRQDHRREDLVSAGPDDADAGVFGRRAGGGQGSGRQDRRRKISYPLDLAAQMLGTRAGGSSPG